MKLFAIIIVTLFLLSLVSADVVIGNTTGNIQGVNIQGKQLTQLGDTLFNGGWNVGGCSVINGDLYCQQLFSYNISTLNISTINTNGSMIPFTTNLFDIGSLTKTWRNGYFGTDVFINGVSVNQFLYNQSDGSYNATYVIWAYNQTIASGTPFPFQKTATSIYNDTLNGNLSLGSSANYNKLNVNGSMAFNSENAPILQRYIVNGTEAGRWRFDGSAATSRLILQAFPSGVYSHDAITQYLDAEGDFILNNKTKNLLYVEGSNGRVGIGTNVPSTNLHIHGNGSGIIISNGTEEYNISIASGSGKLSISDNLGFGDVAINPNSLLELGVTGTDAIYLGRAFANAGNIETTIRGTLSVTNATSWQGLYQDGTGKVGIGTTTPKPIGLDIIGTPKSGFPLVRLAQNQADTASNIGNTTRAFVYYLQLGGQEYSATSGDSNISHLIGFGYTGAGFQPPAYLGYIETSAGSNTLGDLVFATRSVTTNTTATERLRIKDSGNIGIGTSAPKQVLDVRGNLNMSGGGNITLEGGKIFWNSTDLSINICGNC